VVAGGVTVVFSALGGLTGVLLTDFLLFFTAMFGSIAAAVVAVGHPEVGGLGGLLATRRSPASSPSCRTSPTRRR
jgi:solute:Na+ symporter, SSS family